MHRTWDATLEEAKAVADPGVIEEKGGDEAAQGLAPIFGRIHLAHTLAKTGNEIAERV